MSRDLGRPRRRLRLVPPVILLVAGLLVGNESQAQAVQPREALEDAKLYFTAPLRWDGRDWLEFGGTLAAIGVAAQFDEDVRDHFAGTSPQDLNGEDPHGSDDAVPALVLLTGTWLLAGIADEPGGWREFGSMLEATVLTAASGEVLKYTLGRQRPNETTDAGGWFNGGDAFPSLHAGAAFAIGTVFAESGDERHRWLRRTIGYGVAGYTAYARVEHNAHWTSDVIAGAALGLSTARFTLNRREKDGDHVGATASLRPIGADGLMLAVYVPLR